MTTLADLRRAIEAMPHNLNCQLIEYEKPLRKGTPNPVCTCKHGKALAALDAVEREQKERERRLREDVLEPLNDGFLESACVEGVLTEYDFQSVNFAHGHLADILHPPATAPGEDEESLDSEHTGG